MFLKWRHRIDNRDICEFQSFFVSNVSLSIIVGLKFYKVNIENNYNIRKKDLISTISVHYLVFQVTIILSEFHDSRDMHCRNI